MSLRPAGSPLGSSPYCTSTHRILTVPRAGLATRNQRMAATLKAKGYQYRYVYAENAGHTDGKVTRQTLPGALEWLWAGYQPK